MPRPADWGGIRVCPHTVEFWQDRPTDCATGLTEFYSAPSDSHRRLIGQTQYSGGCPQTGAV
ncbi:MAG: pyridoxine 5'-phosphate oxidase C-terminal domain-containing protein [Pseudonocardiaceae bacterium]